MLKFVIKSINSAQKRFIIFNLISLQEATEFIQTKYTFIS